MLNKKEYIMLELIKKTEIDPKDIEYITEWILQSGERYQQDIEEAERMLDDEAQTLDLDSGEL